MASARAGSTSPSWSRLTASAIRSNGVGWAFTITRRARFAGAPGSPAAGYTPRRYRGRGTRRRRRTPVRHGGGPRPRGSHRTRSSPTSGSHRTRGTRDRPRPADAVERGPMGPRHPHDMHFTSRTLPWISMIRSGVAGRVVQPVDVLGHERVQVRAALDLGERDVAGVRLRVPHAARQPVLPRMRRASGSDR